MSPLALQALSGFADRAWADPQLTHHEGRTSAAILQAARATVAQVVGCQPGQVSFHRSDSVAGLAVAGVSLSEVTSSAGDAGTPLRQMRSVIERDVVLKACDDAAVALPVDSVGRVVLPEVFEAGDVAVIQAANLEIGTRQDLGRISELVRAAGACWVCDLTGALGMVALDFAGMTVSFSDAYCWGGPAGVAVLAVHDPSRWRTPDGVETGPDGLPLDTCDVLTSAAAAAALHTAMTDLPSRAERMHRCTQRVRIEAAQLVDDVDVLGADFRLPHVVTLSVLYADGERLATDLDRRGIAVGSGSACAARSGLPSHVLEAIGALTHGNIRISLPLDASDDDIDRFLSEFPSAAAEVRAEAGAP